MGKKGSKLFAGTQRWPRFSQYEMLTDKVGELYITPAKGAEVEYYRPLDKQQKILLEYLKMAKSLYEEEISPLTAKGLRLRAEVSSKPKYCREIETISLWSSGQSHKGLSSTASC